jgi:hypothetical protein
MSETDNRSSTRETLSGRLTETVEHLWHEGTTRRVVVRQDGREVAAFPLAVGVVAAALAPVPAALGAVAVLVADCSVRVEPVAQPAGEPGGTAAPEEPATVG